MKGESIAEKIPRCRGRHPRRGPTPRKGASIANPVQRPDDYTSKDALDSDLARLAEWNEAYPYQHRHEVWMQALSSVIEAEYGGQDDTELTATMYMLFVSDYDVIEDYRRDWIKAWKRTLDARVDGYVYVLFSPELGCRKIGRSRTPNARISSLTIQLPFEVRVECIIPSENHARTEADLQRLYKDKRLNGEWFALEEWEAGYLWWKDVQGLGFRYPGDEYERLEKQLAECRAGYEEAQRGEAEEG